MAEGQPPPPGDLAPLANSFQQLQMELRAGRLGKEVSKFNGDGHHRFRRWVSDVERVGVALNANDNAMLALCFETLKGPAAENLTRIVRATPNITWQQLRARLTAQYSDVSDAHIALQTLRKIKQKAGESMEAFADRVRTLSEEAYPGVDLQQPLIQNSLVEALIDGVLDDGISKKLMRARQGLADFDTAVQFAVREQQVNKQYGLRRRGEEPMDVSGVKRKTQLDKGSALAVEERLDNLCQRLDAALTTTEVLEPQLTTEDKLGMLVAKIKDLEKKVQGSQPVVPRQPRGQWNPPNNGPTPLLQNPTGDIQHPPKHKWTPDGQPICSYCHNVGHMVRECRTRRAHQRQQLNPKSAFRNQVNW